MQNDMQEVLNLLRAELAFLKRGGYRERDADWRPRFIFEDSGIVCNRDCATCILTQFVAAKDRNKRAPCRYIPLNEQGETVSSLYRTGTQEELEEAVAGWLVATIDRLEEERRSERGREAISAGASGDRF